MIPCKLKRMSNGAYKVFVSPGTLVKMRVNPFHGPIPGMWSTKRSGIGNFARYEIIRAGERQYQIEYVQHRGDHLRRRLPDMYETVAEARVAALRFDQSHRGRL